MVDQKLAATARIYMALKQFHAGDFQVEWPDPDKNELHLWTSVGGDLNQRYIIRPEQPKHSPKFVYDKPDKEPELDDWVEGLVERGTQVVQFLQALKDLKA